MIGFLPGWLAVTALVICTGKLVDVVREKQPVPRWLLLVAGVLAAGTPPAGTWSSASASSGRLRCPLPYSLWHQAPP
jgi:hypothetical protein